MTEFEHIQRRQEVIDQIRQAFGWRKVPQTCLAMPIAGDDPVDGFTLTGHIETKILGKAWWDVHIDNFVMAFFYLSREAQCYYLPGILIGGLEREEPLDELNMYIDECTGTALGQYRDEMWDQLTSAERLAVAEYTEVITYKERWYSAAAIEYWRGNSIDVG